jgi:acetylornithine deacetylase/succinyl-diaminopimelate desuccinylase-like protein
MIKGSRWTALRVGADAMNPSRPLEYAHAHRKRFVAELKRFLSFPSVSSKPERARDVRRCAAWLARHLKNIGLDQVRVIPTRGHPIVYGAWSGARGRPTLILYGHYDVVPAEPLRDWRTPPFTPTLKDGNLYARGAADDKGQLFSHVKALESWLRTERSLPVNVKCIFEGEEEIGSPHLTSFIARNRRALRADAAVISDTRMLAPDRPAISYAQRGGLRAELKITGPPHELHSGNFGGAVLNPAQALCEIIARLHDGHGHIAIPGFYDDVRRWDEAERAFMTRNGPTDEEILHDANIKGAWGEPGFTAYERTTIRPALIVNGIAGGHQGHGSKSIIPASAFAKLSFRLVPDQNPQKIAQLFRDHIARLTPAAVHSSVRTFSPIEPALVDRNHSAVRAATFAYKNGFGSPPVFVRSGGSIPVVHTFQRILGCPAVLMGFGLPDDHIHGPNEKFHLANFYKAIATSIWYLAAAAKLRSAQPAQTKMEWRSE